MYLLKNFPCTVENNSKPVKLPFVTQNLSDMYTPRVWPVGMLTTPAFSHLTLHHMAEKDRKMEMNSTGYKTF